MNLACIILGHKFIAHIYDAKWDSEHYIVSKLNTLICKRCGLTHQQILNLYKLPDNIQSTAQNKENPHRKEVKK